MFNRLNFYINNNLKFLSSNSPDNFIFFFIFHIYNAYKLKYIHIYCELIFLYTLTRGEQIAFFLHNSTKRITLFPFRYVDLSFFLKKKFFLRCGCVRDSGPEKRRPRTQADVKDSGVSIYN